MVARGGKQARVKGDLGEDLACKYLISKGFKILTRNCVYSIGELDIVAIKGRELHFVEVKSKNTMGITEAYEAVTPSKIKKIIRATHMFLAENSEKENLRDLPCHFDVITVDCTEGLPEIIFYQDAFEAETY